MILPGAHGLWAPSVASVFQMLGVGAALSDGALWRPIHSEASVTAFELEHGVELARDKYNARCLKEARRQAKPVLGTHAGFSDWFVPIVAAGRVQALLVTGPFATARPTGFRKSWNGGAGSPASKGIPPIPSSPTTCRQRSRRWFSEDRR